MCLLFQFRVAMFFVPRRSYFLLVLLIVSCFGSVTFAQIVGSEQELLGQLEKAKKVGSKGDVIGATTNLGKWYTQHDKYGKGLTYLLKAKQLNPEDSAQYTIYYAGFASLFREIGAYNASIEYEKKILNQETDPSHLGAYFSAANIAIQYGYLNEPDSALHYFDLQLEISKKMDDYIAVASSKNNKGIAYFDKKDYVNALQMFNEALAMLDQYKSSRSRYFEDEKVTFRYRVLENKGRCLFFMKNYPEAIAILEQTTALMDPGVVNENRHALISAYVQTNQLGKAGVLLNSLAKGINKKPTKEQVLFVQMKIELAIRNNNLAEIKHYQNEMTRLLKQVEMEHQISGNRMSELVSRYLIWESEGIIRNETNQKKFYQNELKLEETKNSFFIFFLIVILLSFGFSGFLYTQIVKNKRRKLALDKERLVLTNERNQMKIRLQEQSLTEFAIDFNKNIEYESLIIDKLRQITQLKNQNISAEISTLIAELKQKQHIDKRAEDLAIESQNLLAGFRYELQQKHPDLNKSDIQLCYLLRLELSNKEIAVIKNVAPTSMKIFKNRLKHKLGLDSEDSLTDYLKSINSKV